MRRNLCLCFDAFGTLFRPKEPIYKQYRDVARDYGIKDLTEEQVASSFKTAFKETSKTYPNYGRATNMGSVTWWTKVIEQTFIPLLASEAELPKRLAPALIQRFNSSEGYDIFSDVLPLFKKLSEHRRSCRESRKENIDSEAPRSIVVGLITNSDDRVPDVLSSLGLRMNVLRHGATVSSRDLSAGETDIDFAVMSYDAYVEKPDRRIFDSAADIARCLAPVESDDWDRVYVGDELEKDAFGAVDAGWDAILIDRSRQYDDLGDSLAAKSRKKTGIRRVDVHGREIEVIHSLDELLPLIKG